MPDRPENPPAFPSGDKAHFPTSTFEPGMSLRDWFAGQALPAVVEAVSRGDHQPRALFEWKSSLGPKPSTEEAIAVDAYALADAMLLTRGEQ